MQRLTGRDAEQVWWSNRSVQIVSSWLRGTSLHSSHICYNFERDFGYCIKETHSHWEAKAMVRSISEEERSVPYYRQKETGSQKCGGDVSSVHKVHPIKNVSLGEWHNLVSWETCPKDKLQEIISVLGFTPFLLLMSILHFAGRTVLQSCLHI